MSRWLKRLLVGGLVFLVLLVVASGVLLATIDQQAYKTWLQEQVQARYGRTLDIKGEVGLSVFPDLGLRVTNVVLSEPDSREWFASVNEANVSVSIKPLFQRKLSIDHVSLDGLDIKLIRDQHGKWNFNDLMNPGRSASQTAGSQAQGTGETAPMTIDLHKLEFKRASVTVFDRDKPWMTAKNLMASVVSTSGGREFDLLASATLNVHQEGQGEISLKSRINMGEDFSKLTATGSEIKATKGQQHENKGLRQVELTVTADSLLAQPLSNIFSASNVVLRAKGFQATDRFEWAGDIPSFHVERSAGVLPAVSGRLRLDGTNAVDAKYQLSGLSLKPGLVDIRQAKLDVGLKQASRFYKLDVEMPVKVKAGKTIDATSARGTLHLAHASLPAGGINLPFTGDMGYDFVKKQASWKLSTSFLNSPIDLSGLASHLDQSVPSISASLDTDVLDLNAIDDFLNQPKPPVKPAQSGVQSKSVVSAQTLTTSDPSTKAASSVPAASASSSSGLAAVAPIVPTSRSVDAEVSSAQAGSVSQASSSLPMQTAKAPATMDLSWMRMLGLDLNVRAARFVWKKLHASQLRFQLNVQQGKAELRSLQASLYGGTLSAEGGLTDSKGLPAFLKGKLNAVQVEPLMTALTGDSMLGGLGTMSFDLKASAVDGTSLLRSLDGQSQIDVKQGFVRGVDLNKGVESLSEPSRRAEDLPLTMDKSKRTNFSSMQTQILFGQGLARLYKLNLSSSNIRITEGKIAQIGLLDGALNLVTNVQFTGNIGVPGARVAIQVRSLVVPLHVGGTLQDPQVRVHWQSMPEDALKQSLQQLLMQGVIGGGGGFVGVGKTSPSTPSESGPEAVPNPATQLENVIRGLFRK